MWGIKTRTIVLERNLKALKEINAQAKPKTPRMTHTTQYRAPVLSLLKDYTYKASATSLDPSGLEAKLQEFGLDGKVTGIRQGPVITRYEVKLATGVRLNQVRALSEDLGLALMSGNIRIQAPIPGTNLVGIEVANDQPVTLGLKQILSVWDRKAILPMALGTDTAGTAKIFDLAKMPHLLIAGQTGSGKSVCLNDIILSILFTKTPEECQLVLVDPKRVEMASYKGLPHLRCPVVTEASDAPTVFASLIEEMERRYEILAGHQVRNIESYNEVSKEHLPYIVTVVDEMADLMMTSGKHLEAMIVRLAQLARAVGIHLVLATQKPVVTVITGLIKSNMPSRISFQVSSKNDSRVILDCNGAEKLVGRGDMLVSYPGTSEPERFHGAWVSDAEIQAVTGYMKGVAL